MRKIISKQEEEKKRKRNQFIVGGVLILIMVSSMLGYAFQSQIFNTNAGTNASITYNGMVFSNQNGFWATDYMNERLVFTYLPSQIIEDDLSNLTKGIGDFLSKPLYISSEDLNAESEIKFNMLPFANEVKNACLEGTSCEGEDTKDCTTDNFIIINNGNEEVREEGTCIFISGEGDGLIKLIDNILFKMFGIRK